MDPVFRRKMKEQAESLCASVEGALLVGWTNTK